MGRAALLLSGCALAAALLAATPDEELEELDAVEVIDKVTWPLEDYVEFARYDSVVISPDGKYLATGWGEDSFQRRLSVVEFPSMKPVSSGVLQVHFGVSDVRWLDGQRLLVQPDWPHPGFRRVREHLGTLLVTTINGRTQHELHRIPVGTLNAFQDLRDKERQAAKRHGPEAFGPLRAVTSRPGQSDQILFQTLWVGADADASGFGIFQLNLKDGKQTRVATLPLRGGQVITGAEQLPVLVAGTTALDEQVVYYLPEEARAEGRDWKLLVNGGSGRRGLRPVAWTGQGEEFYALDGRTTPTRSVVVWNARDNTLRPLYTDPDADMDEFQLDPAGKPWIFSGISHIPVYWYPDPAHPLAQLHRTLTRQLAPERVDIMNATDDLSTAVVRVSSAREPGMFLVVDVSTATSITGMQTYPKLRGRRLSAVDAIEFHARDGQAIRGYLTTPLESDGTPRTRLPLLVISHSGPKGEIAGSRYDQERQLFASRGYAVLEINARGSVGRGAAFEQAGEGRWGREVQDDFVDAVAWAIKDGVAAPGRTCFYGSGYGAYSALMAAAREPDLFQCVIGLAGIYDLPQMQKALASSPSPVQAATQLLFARAFGNDLEELRARSPVNHAAGIEARVLLLQQHQDQQVPREQGQAMNKALRAAGKRVQLDTIGSADGGYFQLNARMDVYRRMLRFLEQNIGK